jgi:hypothetical protein
MAIVTECMDTGCLRRYWIPRQKLRLARQKIVLDISFPDCTGPWWSGCFYTKETNFQQNHTQPLHYIYTIHLHYTVNLHYRPRFSNIHTIDELRWSLLLRYLHNYLQRQHCIHHVI